MFEIEGQVTKVALGRGYYPATFSIQGFSQKFQLHYTLNNKVKKYIEAFKGKKIHALVDNGKKTIYNFSVMTIEGSKSYEIFDPKYEEKEKERRKNKPVVCQEILPLVEYSYVLRYSKHAIKRKAERRIDLTLEQARMLESYCKEAESRQAYIILAIVNKSIGFIVDTTQALVLTTFHCSKMSINVKDVDELCFLD